MNKWGVIAALVGLAGLLFASEVTLGVAIVGFSCLLGILIRIAQAERHQAELKQLLLPERAAPTPGVGSINEKEPIFPPGA